MSALWCRMVRSVSCLDQMVPEKSTIIKSIAGLLRYEGGVGINGMKARSLEAKKIFGYVPEIPAMFEALTVREHIEYVKRAYNSDISEEEIEHC